jgi:hypothetical protein
VRKSFQTVSPRDLVDKAASAIALARNVPKNSPSEEGARINGYTPFGGSTNEG